MKNQIISLIILRIRQVGRISKTVGWGLGLIFLFVCTGIFFPALDRVLSGEAWYSILFCAIGVILLDYHRKDKLFLMSVFSKRNHHLCFLTIEYVLLLLPVIIFQLCMSQFIVATLLILVCFIVSIISPLIRSKEGTSVKSTLNVIHLKYFEFKFFIETSVYFWILFWFLGFISYLHIGFYIFWIFIILMILPEIFRYYETRDMVHWKEKFVIKKVLSYTGLFLLIVALPSVIALIFHEDMFGVILYCIFCLMTSIFMNISIKYSGITPLHTSGYGQNTSGLLTMLMIIPGGVLIVFAFGMFKYFKAEANVNLLYA